ncbi:hypothetical protein Pmar_PMAR020567 [Perkinsus marinus ATCC 50983]|uniref:Uncharacterized protein n=1 Tax=Perkinsus marinus (strain ATCC 50983 / TXsc) TaxID=423536 RepID=C5L7E0_PERM5|nr:hypothetical protein Pmar_PMAR020567 [Perkinsus marinus ATCC 50983]EER07402.1 hypothetical protein Pmar_PMAR020567 [Perkinsus marinus ATCC 50983]|eukprot:XP_002775586.1 hypothetical protein Pmar_PMAR020567 [Perkinsus marinus ATCC 50983]
MAEFPTNAAPLPDLSDLWGASSGSHEPVGAPHSGGEADEPRPAPLGSLDSIFAGKGSTTRDGPEAVGLPQENPTPVVAPPEATVAVPAEPVPNKHDGLGARESVVATLVPPSQDYGPMVEKRPLVVVQPPVGEGDTVNEALPAEDHGLVVRQSVVTAEAGPAEDGDRRVVGATAGKKGPVPVAETVVAEDVGPVTRGRSATVGHSAMPKIDATGPRQEKPSYGANESLTSRSLIVSSGPFEAGSSCTSISKYDRVPRLHGATHRTIGGPEEESWGAMDISMCNIVKHKVVVSYGQLW